MQDWTSRRSTLTSLSSWTQGRHLIVEWLVWRIAMIATPNASSIKTQSAAEASTTTRYRRKVETVATIIQAIKCIRMSLVLVFRRTQHSLKCHHLTWCMGPAQSCSTTITLADLTTKISSSIDTLIKNQGTLWIKLQTWCLTLTPTSSQPLANLAKSTSSTSMVDQSSKIETWTWERESSQPATWTSMEHRRLGAIVQTSISCQDSTMSIKVTPSKQTRIKTQETTPRWCTSHQAPPTTSSPSSQTLTWCSTS